MTRVVTAAGPGSIIDGKGPRETLAPVYLWNACAKKGVGYYCETHHESLPHIEALVLHLDDEKDHHLARVCPEHGYEAMPESQLRALTGAAA